MGGRRALEALGEIDQAAVDPEESFDGGGGQRQGPENAKEDHRHHGEAVVEHAAGQQRPYGAAGPGQIKCRFGQGAHFGLPPPRS